MQFQDVVNEIQSRVIMPNKPPSLEPMQKALSRFSWLWPDDLKRIILVAGTNGKGSVSKTLATLLEKAGYQVGLYTSPHLVSICERIQRQSICISETDFVKIFLDLDPVVKDLNLSHFEILTLMAVYYFFGVKNEINPRDPVQWAVMEVGLGGVWDATNAIPHQSAVITSLSLDHQNLLGSSLEEIAWNKMGIVSNNSLVVHLPFNQEHKYQLEKLKEKKKHEVPSIWHETSPFKMKVNFKNILNNNTNNYEKNYKFKSGQFEPQFFLCNQWGEIAVNLSGLRGVENSHLALETLNFLGFDVTKLCHFLKEVHWPGRMERLNNVDYAIHDIPCPLYLSGDHNSQGIESLCNLLQYYSYDQLHFLIGIGKDKDYESMLSILNQVPRCNLWLTHTPFKGASREDYGPWIKHKNTKGYFVDPIEALNTIAKLANPSDCIIITGSLYLVGEVSKVLKHKSSDLSHKSNSRRRAFRLTRP